MVKRAIEQDSKTREKKSSKNSVAKSSELKSVASTEDIVDDNPKKAGTVIDRPFDRPKMSRKHTMPTVLRLVLSLGFIGIMSTVFTWFVFVRQNNYDFDLVLEFINEKPYLFAYSNLVVLLIMLFVACITWTTFFSTGLVFSAISIVSYINMEKMNIRSIPLLPEDFMLAGSMGELTGFVDVWGIVRLAVGVVLVMVGATVLEYCARRTIGRDTRTMPWWEKHSVVPRVCLSLIAGLILISVTEPLVRQEECDWIEGLDVKVWNPIAAYEDNGFIIAFLYNLGKLDQKEPEDYSEAEMMRIADKYRSIKEADTTRKPLSEVTDNLIVILDETFYDPEIYEAYAHTGGDVLPEVHKILQQYHGGYMFSPEYGGGTANVEFEVFTGLSNYWAQNYPYVNSLAGANDVLSVANWSQEFGLEAIAIHSYDGTLYKRNIVYPSLGFDKFIDSSEMQFKEYEYASEYINDRSVYNEILSILESSDTPQMIGAITMQNHAPYSMAQYPNLRFRLKNQVKYKGDLEHNFQSLYYADMYIGEFLDSLNQLDEKTTVLLFGDHVAGILSEYFYADNKEEKYLAHLTPYFIYTSFKTKNDNSEEDIISLAQKKNRDLGFKLSTDGVDLSTTTPNCLLNNLFNLLGAEKPALFYLLDEVCTNYPVLAANYYADQVPEEDEILHDYKLVNYDVLSGKHYWYGD